MRLTKQGEYALRSLISLGVAREFGRELVPVSELAAEERLPLKFVERILGSLREAGYVAAQRGKAGGYFLARPANEIVMGQVVRLIDGRLAPIGCASEADYEACSCPDEAHCGLRMLMIDVRNAIAGILDRYTLADIVAVTLHKLKRDGVVFGASASRGTRSSERRTADGRIDDRRRESSATPRHADPRDGFLASIGTLVAQAPKVAKGARSRSKRKVGP